MFKKKIEKAFDQVKDQTSDYDEEKYRATMQDEMEKGDLLAMILGAFRFFLPLFIVIIVLIVLIFGLS
ncbi:MAG: hypothetical protein WAV55_04905 [Clostridiaceae bacterium]